MRVLIKIYRKLRPLKKTLEKYFLEIIFFRNAHKKNGLEPEGINLMLIRKKAHHLEKYLFFPNEFDDNFGKICASALEKLLKNEGQKDAPEVIWAQKILSEYKNRQIGGRFGCPKLSGNIKREMNSEISTQSLMKLLRERRSRRIFKQTTLSQEQKEKICEAAGYAPSSCNRQTIEMIFVEESELKKFIASTIPGGKEFFNYAPVIIIFISKAGDYKYPEDRAMPFIDSAAAIENINLICETMGLGCCWGSYSSFGSILKEKKVRQRLKIPKEYLIVGSLAIGESDQNVCPIPRSKPADRYHNNQYRKK